MNKKIKTFAPTLALVFGLAAPSTINAGNASTPADQTIIPLTAGFSDTAASLRLSADEWRAAEARGRLRERFGENLGEPVAAANNNGERDIAKTLTGNRDKRRPAPEMKPRVDSALPKEKVADEMKMNLRRQKKPTNLPNGAEETVKKGKSMAHIRQDFFIGVPLTSLNEAQRMELRGKFEALLTEKETWAVLNAIQRAEGGGPKVVVGGIRGKLRSCQRLIGKLTTKSHPKEQGLPNQCFLTTQAGLSTAAGNYQIVYYRNWRHLKRLLNLDSFSERNQALAVLELMRSSAARDGRIGEGLVALVKGDVETAIRKGTDPWASSPYSRWGGAKAPIGAYAQKELKKLRNAQYAQAQAGRFGGGDDS